MTKSLLITISGVDGSGKSTQAARLAAFLRARGLRVYRLHAVSFSIAQRLLKRTRPTGAATTTHAAGTAHNHSHTSSAARDTGASRTRASRAAIALRKVALCIDLVRFALLRRRLARAGYDVILSDRFFFDTVVNIRYLERRSTVGLLERLVPRADVALLLTIAPERIMQRARVPEQGLAYLRTKTALLRARRDAWRLRAIDADRAPEAVFAAITAALPPSLTSPR